MAFNSTTLSSAITNSQTVFGVASATGITAPIFNTGVGFTYLFVETEMMFVTGITGTTVTVQRGVLGSPAGPHGSGAVVLAGLPTDFAGIYAPSVKAQQDATPSGSLYGFSASVTLASTIQATGPLFHIVGTAGTVATILPPPGYAEGSQIIIVCDVATTFSGGNIAAATTAIAAGSAIWFVFDQGSGKWHPSRTA